MPKWIRDSGGRLIKCDTPQRGEFEVILNIMEAAPEDQHSHQGRQDNLNEFRSMRDRMHPPRMSAPSCIVPPTEQLVIRPYLVPLLPTFHGWKVRIPKENEKFYECWERYMEAINACPHHGLILGYWGWDEPTKEKWERLKSQLNAYNAKAGMYNLKEDDDMKAKLAAMTRRLEELELKRIHEVQAVAEALVQVKLCPNCQSFEHLVEECPAIPTEREYLEIKQMLLDQFRPNNNAPYGNTYNSSWRNHPNFSWKARATQYQQPDPPSQQSSRWMGMQNDMNQKFDNIQYSISRLTNLNTLQEKGRFPSQPHQNPKGVHEVESQEGESSQVKDVKALITLRSEKELLKEEMLKKSTSPPFPQALHGKKGIRNAAEILEVLRQVKVNIPLLDMIKQVPTYAKFLKDLCTIKRGLTVNKKAFLTEQVSAILQCKSPLKYKDPGSPTISVMIGGKVVEKALLDLGASVNLLPYSSTSNWDLES
ncbi:hypothetical protein CK203_115347 [Vitis vinifera]|uniref:Retrotransposon gag domain-containing protein n=1 Tax=Vitis vinifera TaxID=29760 RepID=A0A438C9A6_VITVI|nr:hypothetical protein CK203_115347 [Vitis vinifera]